MKKNMMIISMDCFEAAKSDAYIDGKVAGRKEVLDKLYQWVQGRRDIFHDCIIDFIDDNTPKEVDSFETPNMESDESIDSIMRNEMKEEN